ncbi:MAG: kelch repeat-containing protein [Leptospiraceae bacterium]|nr:kelch repeat-containing protein [Leptospiraceae bacterium]
MKINVVEKLEYIGTLPAQSAGKSIFSKLFFNNSIIFYFIVILFFVRCENSPLGKAARKDNVRLLAATVTRVTTRSATITIVCSENAKAYLGYGIVGMENFLVSLYEAKNHIFEVGNLKSDQKYLYNAYCGSLSPRSVFIQNFTTQAIPPVPPDPKVEFLKVKLRSLWLIGGINFGGSPIGQVDFYDPETKTWYANHTTLPNPRAFASVIVLDRKIYVMGGLKQNPNYSVSNDVDEYDIDKETWRTMASIPNNLVGAVAGKNNNEIYLIGGTTTTDMTTGTILNTVYRFLPNAGTNGVWSQYLNLGGTIFSRIDMAGCSIDGTIFHTGGRLFSSGAEQSSSDGYVPSANTVTSLIEASISSARHGSASACYEPLPSDPNPNDSTALMVIGGSSGTNANIPANSITPSSVYDYYITGTTTNVFTTGPILPQAVYSPAATISYSERKLYVFGGASAINNPTSNVYTIDLANPIAGPWTSLGAVMPVPRFGHRAVGIR